MRSMYRCSTLGVAGLMMLSAASAHAQETTTYSYDVKGRLIKVCRKNAATACDPANASDGTRTAYTYDAADNRTNVTVSNSSNGTASSDGGSGATVQTARYVIVPLNGYTLIRVGG